MSTSNIIGVTLSLPGIDACEREVFCRLADQLIPSWDNMPALSETDAADRWLPIAMRTRYDLVDSFRRALDLARRDDDLDVSELHDIDPEGFDALTIMAASSYTMSPQVRQLIGYPGQEARTLRPTEDLPYLDMLEHVVERGNPVREP